MNEVNYLKKRIEYLKNINKSSINEENLIKTINDLQDKVINAETDLYYLQKKVTIYEKILKIYDIDPEVIHQDGVELLLIDAESYNFTMPKMSEKEKDRFMIVSEFIDKIPGSLKEKYMNFLMEWNWIKYLTYVKKHTTKSQK